MGILVDESPAGPNTPGFLGVEDLDAGSMGKFIVNPELGFPACHCCAQYTWKWS